MIGTIWSKMLGLLELITKTYVPRYKILNTMNFNNTLQSVLYGTPGKSSCALHFYEHCELSLIWFHDLWTLEVNLNVLALLANAIWKNLLRNVAGQCLGIRISGSRSGPSSPCDSGLDCGGVRGISLLYTIMFSPFSHKTRETPGALEKYHS